MSPRPKDGPAWEQLTTRSDKRAFYEADVCFRESWSDLQEVLGDEVREFLRNVALVIFKPDAIVSGRVVPALEWMEDVLGLRPIAAQRVRLDRLASRELWRYQWNAATLDRLALAEFLLGQSESLLVLLSGFHPDPRPASVRLSLRKGSPHPHEREPADLRSILAAPYRLLSLVHVADEPVDVVRELGVLLDSDARTTLLLGLGDESSRLTDEIGVTGSVTFNFACSLQRVRTALSARSADRALRTLESGVAGGSLAWRTFRKEWRRDGAVIDPWDAITVAASLIENDLEGIDATIDGSGASGWVTR